jgi:hypothetical protein
MSMYGINRYRCFEVSWLTPEGCPAGAVVDVETTAEQRLNTFDLKKRWEQVYGQAHASVAGAIDAALEGLVYEAAVVVDREAPEAGRSAAAITMQEPLRGICPDSGQPYVAYVCFDGKIDEEQRSIIESFIRSLDGNAVSVEKAADAIAGYCIGILKYKGCCLVSSARRGGIAVASFRCSYEKGLDKPFFPHIGIE